MTANARLDHLLRVLADRNITAPESDLRALFLARLDRQAGIFPAGDTNNQTDEPDGGHARAVRWVRRNLSGETLLSVEEFDLFSALCDDRARELGLQSGDPAAVESVLADADGWTTAHGAPMTDEEIVAAAEAVEQAAIVLEQQVQVLEVQRNSLVGLRTAHSGGDSAVPAPGRGRRSVPISARTAAQTDRRRRRYAHEGTDLVGQIEEATHTVRAQLDSRRKMARSLVTSARSQLDTMLDDDDRLLAGVMELIEAAEADHTDDVDVDELMDQVREIVELRTGAQQAVVDAIYNDALTNAPDDTGTDPTDPSSSSTAQDHSVRFRLQQDLDSLFSEIATVADMSATSSLRTPLRASLQVHSRAKHSGRKQAIAKAIAVLDHLITTTNSATEYAQHAMAFQQTIEQLWSKAPGSEPATSSIQSVGSNNGTGMLSKSSKSAAETALQHFGLRLDPATVAALSTTASGGPRPSAAAAVSAARTVSSDLAMRRLKVGVHADKVRSAIRAVMTTSDREEGDVLAAVSEVYGGSSVSLDPSKGLIRNVVADKHLGDLESVVVDLTQLVEDRDREDCWDAVRARLDRLQRDNKMTAR